jgi:hypothetical protein
MKQDGISSAQHPNQSEASQLASAKKPSQINKDFTPSKDAVAKAAYFNYLNGGSQPGQEEKHWLEAEARLFAEINYEMHIPPH